MLWVILEQRDKSKHDRLGTLGRERKRIGPSASSLCPSTSMQVKIEKLNLSYGTCHTPLIQKVCEFALLVHLIHERKRRVVSQFNYIVL